MFEFALTPINYNAPLKFANLEITFLVGAFNKNEYTFCLKYKFTLYFMCGCHLLHL